MTFASISMINPSAMAPPLREAIDRELADGFPLMRFEPALEQRFEADEWRDRTRNMTRFGFLTILIYDCFLLTDWDLVPDVFWDACLLRLAVFTPLALLAIVLGARTRSVAFRESVWVGLAVLAVALIMVLFVSSTSPNRSIYHYGPMLIMIFGAAAQRLRLPYFIAANVLIVAIVITGMMISGLFSARVLRSDSIFFVSGAVLLIASLYGLERETRLSYLLSWRSRLVNAQLDHNARHDPLTGLWNRRHLNAAMQATWASTQEAPTPVALVLLDLDFFKRFNDFHGHLEGDACLQRVARCLGEVADADRAIAIRFGGEEFMIFLPGADRVAALSVAESLRQRLRQEAIAHRALGRDTNVTASFGVAAGLAPSIAPGHLIAAADAALYQAKAAGRDCIRLAPNDPR